MFRQFRLWFRSVQNSPVLELRLQHFPALMLRTIFSLLHYSRAMKLPLLHRQVISRLDHRTELVHLQRQEQRSCLCFGSVTVEVNLHRRFRTRATTPTVLCLPFADVGLLEIRFHSAETISSS